MSQKEEEKHSSRIVGMVITAHGKGRE